MISAYLIHILIIICIQLILALSLQISVGFTGLLNFGHVAFYGIGAYTAALLALNGVPFLICIIASCIVPAIFAFLISIPTNKLKGDYLAISTIAFSYLIYALMINWTSLTRGPLGLPGIPKPSLLGITFNSNLSFLILIMIFVLLTYFILKKIVNSKFGKLFQAVRDNELALKALGKNTFKIKTISLIVSAIFAGLAGAFFSYFITFIDPSSFTFMALIPVFSIIIVGGLASLKGTIIATAILTVIPEILRFVGMPSSLVGPGRQILFALLLLLILIYYPKGFFGKTSL